MLDDALAHALAGDDIVLAADLVELGLPQLSRQRQDRTLRAWVDSLPEPEKRRRPLLATGHAWSRLSQGDLDAVEPWLDAAETALGSGPTGLSGLAGSPPPASLTDARDAELRSLPAMISVYRAAVAQAKGDVAGTIAHAQRAMGLAADDDHAVAGGRRRLPRPGRLGGRGPGHRRRHVQPKPSAACARRESSPTNSAPRSSWPRCCWPGAAPTRPDGSPEQALDRADQHPAPLTTTGDLHVCLADIAA